MMRLATIAGIVLAATPAFAGQGFMCSGSEGVSVSLPLGGGIGLTVLSAKVEANGKVWSTEAGQGIQIAPAQSFGGSDFDVFDFADPNFNEILVEVRLFVGHEDGSEPVFGGTLRVKGAGAWAISCDVG